jgi:hypothetical protein
MLLAPNANRNSTFTDVDGVPGQCLNNLPVRVNLGHSAVTILGYLIAQIHAQAVAAIWIVVTPESSKLVIQMFPFSACTTRKESKIGSSSFPNHT